MTDLYKIGKSLTLTIAISLAVSLSLLSIGKNFWVTMAIVTTLQFIGSYIFNLLYKTYIIYKNNAQAALQTNALDSRGIDLDCAFCGEKNLIPIEFDTDNRFNCIKCDKENAVYVNITTAQTTIPLATSSVSTNVFDDNIQLVKDKILDERN
jgi:hypothetical protein